MTLLNREKAKKKCLCLLLKMWLVKSQNLLTKSQNSARNSKLIAKKKPPWVEAFLKNIRIVQAVEGEHNPKNQERFRTMITIKTMVCQIKNILPQKMVFCGKD